MTAAIQTTVPNHPPVKFGKVGVLLVNLGTPDGTDKVSMRRYLKEFLMDRRVIEWSPFFWYPILFGIVLNTRPAKVGKAYETIWNKDLNESYLRTYTRNQAEIMARSFADLPNVRVDWAMRYGQPSIRSKMDELQKDGCEKILVFPLYPQYAAATTATVNDEAFKALLKMRWQPALRTVAPYHDDPVYIEALAQFVHPASCHARLGAGGGADLLPWHPEILFHEGRSLSLPVLQDRAAGARKALAGRKRNCRSPSSRVSGPEEWLQPHTDKTVEKLGRDGVKRIAVINPGFVSDCLETLEEIAVEAAETFHHAGGEKFTHIPCLNDSEGGMTVLEHVVRRELMGWA